MYVTHVCDSCMYVRVRVCVCDSCMHVRVRVCVCDSCMHVRVCVCMYLHMTCTYQQVE
jgi:hypothetical protein